MVNCFGIYFFVWCWPPPLPKKAIKLNLAKEINSPTTRGRTTKMMQNGEFLAALRVQNMASRGRGRFAAIFQNFREIVGNSFVSANGKFRYLIAS